MSFSFQPVTFSGVREVVPEPVAAAVRASSKTKVTMRIAPALAKKCAFKAGDFLTPFVDEPNRTILLLSDQRPLPKSARKVWQDGEKAPAVIEFPRNGILEEFFPVAPMRGMILREASHGRLVFSIPKI